jgi:hypothetical protein
MVLVLSFSTRDIGVGSAAFDFFFLPFPRRIYNGFIIAVRRTVQPLMRSNFDGPNDENLSEWHDGRRGVVERGIPTYKLQGCASWSFTSLNLEIAAHIPGLCARAREATGYMTEPQESNILLSWTGKLWTWYWRERRCCRRE